MDLSVKGERKDALYEEWTLIVYAVTGGRLFEIESRQRCATADPVILREHNFGGMAVRGPYAWQGQPDAAKFEAICNDYANPPTLAWEPQ